MRIKQLVRGLDADLKNTVQIAWEAVFLLIETPCLCLSQQLRMHVQPKNDAIGLEAEGVAFRNSCWQAASAR